MENYQSLQFQYRYRSGDKNALPKDFYNAVLPLSKTYCRAVGFFSSTCFLEISYGIIGLLKNNGKMLLITSPRLQDDDVTAIENGYATREIYLKAFMQEMAIPKDITEKNRLNVLANLIENGTLEIKIAVTDNPARSMYREKIGLFIDADSNKIAISGSMNESRTAMTENFESLFYQKYLIMMLLMLNKFEMNFIKKMFLSEMKLNCVSSETFLYKNYEISDI